VKGRVLTNAQSKTITMKMPETHAAILESIIQLLLIESPCYMFADCCRFVSVKKLSNVRTCLGSELALPFLELLQKLRMTDNQLAVETVQ
jgi:hypothetical protein